MKKFFFGGSFILACLLLYFACSSWIPHFFNPIPSLKRGTLSQALNNCRQFSLASEAYFQEFGSHPTIDDLIAKKILTQSDLDRLFNPSGAYCFYFPSDQTAGKQPTVIFYSEIGTARYSPEDSSLKENKK